MSTPSTRGNLVVYGAGGHGLVVADAAAQAGFAIVSFVDDSIETGLTVGAWPVLADRPDEPCIVAVGDNAARLAIVERLVESGASLSCVVHPAAVVSPLAEIGDGAYIGPGAVVNAEAMVGLGALINSGAIVEHHVQVHRCAHVAPGAVLCGSVHVGQGAMIGAGAVVLPGLTIGERAVVGGGSVVIDHVQPGQTVVGHPARSLT
jgi:UDP-N-acetylbacillosamine N-acetyltransferase